MKSFAAALCLGLAVTPALAADYDATEKSPLYVSSRGADRGLRKIPEAAVEGRVQRGVSGRQ